MRPKLLDLYCGAGGAAVGYHRAGFDVLGVDNRNQPHYPFEFVRADALTYLHAAGARFDAVHASPPCRDHTRHTRRWGLAGSGDLLARTRDALAAGPWAWVIENVPGAPMRSDYKLCGCMFGLPGLRRERWFETSWHGFDLRSPCTHAAATVTVAGKPGGSSVRDGELPGSDAWCAAMGIDWMSTRELAQAIPPAYTAYIGAELLAALVHQGTA